MWLSRRAVVGGLAGLSAAALFVSGVAATAAKRATTTIPIVFAAAGDSLAAGLVESLARPGGNLTGVSGLPDPTADQKRLQLLTEAVPLVNQVGVLLDTRKG